MSDSRLLSVAVTSGDHDDGRTPSQPWHNRTPTVVGASVLALAVIGILVLAITLVSREFSEPEQAPLNYIQPTYSATPTRSGAATTTQTITSTSPPQTTEIGGPLDPLTPTPSTTPSTTSSGETTSEAPAVEEPPQDGDEESTTRTTRRGPRTNVTRTLNPFR